MKEKKYLQFLKNVERRVFITLSNELVIDCRGLDREEWKKVYKRFKNLKNVKINYSFKRIFVKI